MARPFQLIAFDLDGTLVDSSRDIEFSTNTLIAEHGGRPLSAEAVVGMVGSGARVLVERAFEAAGLGRATDAALARFLAIYDLHLLDHTRPYEGVSDLLAALGRAGYSLGVLTNKPRNASLRVLDGLGLTRHFARVVGGDGLDGRKPNPAGLLSLMATTNARAGQTMLVGDSLVDLQAGRNAGVTVCVARYGFGYAGIPSEALEGDETVIDAPIELLERIGESGLSRTGEGAGSDLDA